MFRKIQTNWFHLLSYMILFACLSGCNTCHSNTTSERQMNLNDQAFSPRPRTASAPPTGPGYDIIIIGGQSNAVGSGRGPYSDPLKSTTTDAKIFQVGRTIIRLDGKGHETGGTCASDEGQIIPATDNTLEHWYNCPGHGSPGFGMAFARRWALHRLAPGRKVLLVPGAFGGTSINQWLNPDVHMPHGVNLLDDLIAKTTLALIQKGPEGEAYDNRIVAMLWSQGESDVVACAALNPSNKVGDYCNYSNTDSVVNQWIKKTAVVFRTVRTRFYENSGDFPILAIGYVPTWTAWQNGSNLIDLTAHIQAFQNQLKNMSEYFPAFRYVDTAGLGSNADAGSFMSGVSPDLIYDESHVHFNADSLIKLGDRLFATYESNWQASPTQALAQPTGIGRKQSQK